MPGIIKYSDSLKALGPSLITFSGIVKVENVSMSRMVYVYNQRTGVLVGSDKSDALTGAWSVTVNGGPNDAFFAVCIPEVVNRNAQVFAHLVEP